MIKGSNHQAPTVVGDISFTRCSSQVTMHLLTVGIDQKMPNLSKVYIDDKI
jgi:hypothetical protein